MPAILPIVAKGIGEVLQYLRDKQVAKSLGLLWVGLRGTAEWIQWFSTFVTNVFSAAKGGEDASEQWAANTSGAMAKIGEDLKEITEHTYTTVIPHSLRWLNGYVFSHGIVPLRNLTARMEREIGAISGRVSVLEFWRKDYADPHIMDWRRFNSFFHTWPIGVVTQWHEWFQRPHDFALWAAPPLIGPLVSYLAAPEHQETRDNLTLIVLQAMQEVPNRAWEDVLAWVVTDS